jgi:hypothetical protein
MIKHFTLGAIGSLISAISLGLIIVVDLFSPKYLIDKINYGRFPFILIPVLLGVGFLLASFGYREIKNKYDLLSGTASFVFGIIASVFVFLTVVVDLITPEYMILIYPPPLIYRINSWLYLLNGLFFGFTQVIWGITHFKSLNFCKKPNLSLLTSGFFVISGVLFLVSSVFGFGFSFISLLFASIVFLNFSSNANQGPENKINENLQKEG